MVEGDHEFEKRERRGGLQERKGSRHARAPYRCELRRGAVADDPATRRPVERRRNGHLQFFRCPERHPVQQERARMAEALFSAE